VQVSVVALSPRLRCGLLIPISFGMEMSFYQLQDSFRNRGMCCRIGQLIDESIGRAEMAPFVIYAICLDRSEELNAFRFHFGARGLDIVYQKPCTGWVINVL
jgi:hypothetical protein